MNQSDQELVEFLSKCDSVVVHAVLKAMRSRFSRSSKRLAEKYRDTSHVPAASSPERTRLAEQMVEMLRWYGSNAIAYAARRIRRKEPSVHYHRILRDVAKTLNRCKKRKERLKLPRVATVSEWEELICCLLLDVVLKDKSVEEMAVMLQEAGLAEEAAKDAAKKFGPGASAIGLPMLAKLLGKKTLKNLLEELIVVVVGKWIGKDSARILAVRLLGSVAQKMVRKIVVGVGWSLVVLDVVLFLAAPAKRVTVPTVSLIAALRTRERLNGS